MKIFCKTVVTFFAVFTFSVFCTVYTFADAQSSIAKIKSDGFITMSTSAPFEPFEYLENNVLKGVDIDIAQKVADKLSVKLKVNNVSIDSLTFELKNSFCDFVCAGLSETPERAKNLDFSEPYFETSQAIVIAKDSAIKNSKDLEGKVVGVQIGTTADIYCSEDKNILKVVRFDKHVDAVQDLMAGQIDAVIVDDFAADKLVNLNKDKIHKLDEELTSESYSIAVKKGNHELLSIINDVIKEIKENGELDKIISKHYSINHSTSDKFVEYSGYIAEGLKNTLLMSLCAAIIGIILGIIIASIKVFSKGNKKLKIFSFLADTYITIIRGTPALIQLFIMYYGILGSFKVSNIVAAILAFGINSGAYVAEHVRAGIQSVDYGQMEAGRSLGLSQNTTLIKIILPQALKNILPSLAGEAITLLKETSVAGFIGIVDLSRAGDIIKSMSYEALRPLSIVAGIYLILVVGLTSLLKKFEKRLNK
ncbi:MAG: ABC transporter substrate-binding protein/permease [Clostridia bacterium]|nr:ABC transporter substrate-binding protein/permease [Clostridia bacterium]